MEAQINNRKKQRLSKGDFSFTIKQARIATDKDKTVITGEDLDKINRKTKLVNFEETPRELN